MKKLHQFVAHILVESKVNHLFFIFSLLIQVIQTLLISIECEQLLFLRDVFLLTFFNSLGLCGLFILLELTLLVSLTYGYFLFHKDNGKLLQKKKLSFTIITTINNYIIILFKTILLLPLNYTIFKVFSL